MAKARESLTTAPSAEANGKNCPQRAAPKEALRPAVRGFCGEKSTISPEVGFEVRA